MGSCSNWKSKLNSTTTTHPTLARPALPYYYCIYLLEPNVHVNYLENTSTDVLKAKSPLPLVMKRMRTSLGRAGIYQCFIKSFSKMSRLLWHLLAKDHTKTLLDKAIVRKEFGQQTKQYIEEVAFFATSAPP
ncbi:hypothetical protein L3X38_035995 [Prunus dulcis]|uniref:Uncharacterized protein n=1 Tax=Prunus dulcis TaxID=3755 RepID=A0AAD4VLR1_PRUDU|nr:hypothetical protein L3X38_035995 [Prunus dulcis]